MTLYDHECNTRKVYTDECKFAFAQVNDTLSIDNSTTMNATLPMTILGINGTSNLIK